MVNERERSPKAERRTDAQTNKCTNERRVRERENRQHNRFYCCTFYICVAFDAGIWCFADQNRHNFFFPVCVWMRFCCHLFCCIVYVPLRYRRRNSFGFPMHIRTCSSSEDSSFFCCFCFFFYLFIVPFNLLLFCLIEHIFGFQSMENASETNPMEWCSLQYNWLLKTWNGNRRTDTNSGAWEWSTYARWIYFWTSN